VKTDTGIEKAGYIPSGDGQVYCFVSAPQDPPPGPEMAVLLLGPLAEEKKSSLRALVEMARSLAAAGLTALRVDFRGTGDASGTSEELSIESMIEDVLAASAFAARECGAKRVGVVGLRLGGAVAVLSASRSEVDAMVLVEPVVSGEAYVRSLFRQQAVRRMLTSGKGSKPEGEEDAHGPLDLDGLALDRGFIAELQEVDVTRAAMALRPGPCPAAFVLQVAARAEPSRELSVLGEALGESTRVEAVVARPFWLQTDYVDPEPVTRRVVEFLRSAFGDRLGGGEEVDSE
jgi:pimeloyl-ACP methyl ester carboxylesterase